MMASGFGWWVGWPVWLVIYIHLSFLFRSFRFHFPSFPLISLVENLVFHIYIFIYYISVVNRTLSH